MPRFLKRFRPGLLSYVYEPDRSRTSLFDAIRIIEKDDAAIEERGVFPLKYSELHCELRLIK
jgi:hypothetical protein